VAPLEPWEKVLIKLSVFESTDDPHLKDMKCVDCHGGDSNYPNNMEMAHKGFVADPSEFDASGNNSCIECHSATTNSYKNSLHQKLWGEKRTIAIRTGNQSFDQCPQVMQDGFTGECGACHATCGDCHVSIPNSAGKGFINSHTFNAVPDDDNNCMACHGSRIAHDFLGDYDIYPIRYKDIHRENGHGCLYCHDKQEMHSAVQDQENTHRYNYEHAPFCEMCHINGDNSNIYHSQHYDDLSCYVCHSQNYNNCTSCHTNGEWKTDEVYQGQNPAEDFRIGLNPLKGDKRYKYATVRHIPIAPETYDNWGAAGLMTDYNVLPTWKYTSPHSIRLYTARTNANDPQTCMINCHIDKNPGRNAKFFLTEQYIQTHWPDEVNANSTVVVDDSLPGGWQ